MKIQATAQFFAATSHLRLPLLALDVGTKKTGVAVTDRSHQISWPLGTATHSSFAPYNTRQIRQLLEKHDIHRVAGLIIGMPISKHTGEADNRQSNKVRSILEQMASGDGELFTNVCIIDERYSTMAARQRLAQAACRSFAKRTSHLGQYNGNIVDALAAQEILERYLMQMQKI